MAALSISVVESAPRLLAAVRRQATNDNVIGLAVSNPVWVQLQTRGLATTGRVINIFWNDAEHDLEAPEGVPTDMGVEVLAPFEGDATLNFVTTPTGRAATAVHQGGGDGLPATRAAIRDWCAAEGLELAGVSWEVHHWNDDEALRTADVYYLLA